MTLQPRGLYSQLMRHLGTALSWSIWRPGWAFHAMCVLLFVVGCVRFFVPFDPGSEVPEGYEAVRVARNLADGRGFASPFHVYATGQTSHLAPVYPFFHAALFRLFGTGDIGNFVFRNAEAVALALQIALLPILARAFRMHTSAGLIAAVGGLAPSVLQAYPRWESNYVAVLVMLATWGMCRLARSEPPVRITVLIAFLWGLVILANPNSVLPFGAWLAWWGHQLVFWDGTRSKKSIRTLLIVAVVPALVILPWVIRNYAVFDRLIFIRGNLGLELAVSHNPCAEFGVRMSQRTNCFEALHPNDSLAEAQQLAAMGEPEYFRTRLDRAVEWIEQNPQRFVKLTAQRFWFFWFPSAEGDIGNELISMGLRRGLRAFAIYAITLLSLPGLLLLYSRNRPGGIICLLWLGFFPIIHYVVQFEGRYRTPILWFSFLLAGFTVTCILQRLALPAGSLEATRTLSPKAAASARRSRQVRSNTLQAE